MTAPKHDPKTSILGGFDWTETLKKAGQDEAPRKTAGGPPKPGEASRASIKATSAKQKQPGVKSQLRLRTKV